MSTGRTGSAAASHRYGVATARCAGSKHCHHVRVHA